MKIRLFSVDVEREELEEYLVIVAKQAGETIVNSVGKLGEQAFKNKDTQKMVNNGLLDFFKSMKEEGKE